MVCADVSCNNAPSKRCYWDLKSAEADIGKFPSWFLQETGLVAVTVLEPSTFRIHVVNVT